jgi:hypothetical protein
VAIRRERPLACGSAQQPRRRPVAPALAATSRQARPKLAPRVPAPSDGSAQHRPGARQSQQSRPAYKRRRTAIAFIREDIASADKAGGQEASCDNRAAAPTEPRGAAWLTRQRERVWTRATADQHAPARRGPELPDSPQGGAELALLSEAVLAAEPFPGLTRQQVVDARPPVVGAGRDGEGYRRPIGGGRDLGLDGCGSRRCRRRQP